MNNASVSTKSLLFFVVLALFGISFASAANQVVTWKYEAQEVSLYDGETLTVNWSGAHNVWISTEEGCTGGGQQYPDLPAESTTDDNWTAMANAIDPGTYYLSCRVGSHCENGMTLKVTRVAGSRPASPAPSSSSSTRNAFAFALAASGAALAALV